MKASPIKRILVPLDPSEYTEAATQLACQVAKAHEAQIEGLCVIDTPAIRRDVAPADMMLWPAVIDAITAAEADAKAEMDAARSKFAATCDAEGAHHHETKITGLPASHILEMSTLYDLVVMGMRTYFHFETHGVCDSLAKVLDRTVTPVLAAPLGEATSFKRVIVTYDGSFSSGRALRDFADFAAPYDCEVTLFTAHASDDHAQQLLENAGACLNAHGITKIDNVATKKDPLDALYGEGLIDGADLVVAGVHSRKFLKDAFVGSFANQLIERGDTAVFFSH